MANEKHLYLTVGGGYVSSAVALANETWQFGVRCALVFGDVDDVGTLPNNWEPVADSINRDEEDWTITSNWSVSGPISETFNPTDWLDENVGPAAEALITASGVFSQAVELRELRAYPIGTNGRAIPAPPFAAGSPALLTYKETQPVGGATGTMAPQVTAAISLRTQQVGRRGRGRSFLPMLAGGGVGTGASAGVMISNLQTNLLAACKTFFEDIAIVAGGPTSANVSPIVTGNPWVNYAAIKTIVLDNVYDTQRRRRRSVVSTPASATLEIG